MFSRLGLLLVVTLMIYGCGKPAARLADSDERTPIDNDPFTSRDAHVVDKSPDKTFDELVDMIESTIGDTEELEAKPFDPPLTALDVNNVLQQCLRQILADPDLKDTRDFYGTPGATEIVLVNGSNQNWPPNFKPDVDGYDFRSGKSDVEFSDGNRVLGLRLDKVDVVAPSTGFMDGNITITASNFGGSQNGAVIGGCLMFFTVRRVGDKYVAKYAGLLDP